MWRGIALTRSLALSLSISLSLSPGRTLPRYTVPTNLNFIILLATDFRMSRVSCIPETVDNVQRKILSHAKFYLLRFNEKMPEKNLSKFIITLYERIGHI
jgi:hypothetical protein